MQAGGIAESDSAGSAGPPSATVLGASAAPSLG